MRHIAILDKAPIVSGKSSIPDGAVNGNGDLGVILGTYAEGMRIFLCKCDVWMGMERAESGGLHPLGVVDIPVPAALYEHYYVQQDMDKGELRCTFSDGARCCGVHLRVCKTKNAVMIESVGDVPITPTLRLTDDAEDGVFGEFCEKGMPGIFRSFAGEEYLFETHAFAVLKTVSNTQWAVWAATNHDTEHPKQLCLQEAVATDADRFAQLLRAHDEAWTAFWQKSSFTLSDEKLENGWYASQYLLACCAGNRHFAPGLYGNFVTVEHPNWHSDYHLNYNYQAPFYAACSSNHTELTDCYHGPLEDFLERGKAFAAEFGCRGVLYPVGIGPLGICTEMQKKLPHWFLRLFLGQKSNAIHPADILIFRWRSTRDTAYARAHAYPYIKECLTFFEDYAVIENGFLTIPKDAAHEVPYYKADFSEKKYKYIHDKNNVLTLGLLRMCLAAAVDMAQALGVDADRQSRWQEMLALLPPFPTCRRRGRKVFRYTQSGQRWNDSNDVGLQHVYPCGAVGLSSEPELLKIARNTFRMKAAYCFDDGNAVSSFFPMAARLGITPERIVRKLHTMIDRRYQPNFIPTYAGGCLENCPIVAATLNEMALQSHEGIVRLFPVWDKKIDARFENLRADGAFLVSASMRAGQVCDVRIVSEQGSMLCLQNPYKKTALQMQDGSVRVFETTTITISTKPGDVLCVRAL